MKIFLSPLVARGGVPAAELHSHSRVRFLWNPVPPVYHMPESELAGGSRCLKLAQANNLRDPILKKPITKTGLVEWLKV
jgi:hypothetical protein